MIRCFTMRGQIEALTFRVCIHAQADHHIDEFVKDEGDDARPDQGDRHRFDLDPDLRADRVVIALDAAQRTGRKHTGQNRADDAADAMHTKDVEACLLYTSRCV